MKNKIIGFLKRLFPIKTMKRITKSSPSFLAKSTRYTVYAFVLFIYVSIVVGFVQGIHDVTTYPDPSRPNMSTWDIKSEERAKVEAKRKEEKRLAKLEKGKQEAEKKELAKQEKEKKELAKQEKEKEKQEKELAKQEKEKEKQEKELAKQEVKEEPKIEVKEESKPEPVKENTEDKATKEKEDFIAKCSDYDYYEANRHPSDYLNKLVKLEGKVVEIVSKSRQIKMLHGNNGHTPTLVNITNIKGYNVSKLKKGQTITVYGEFISESDYKAFTGAVIKLQTISGEYIK